MSSLRRALERLAAEYDLSIFWQRHQAADAIRRILARSVLDSSDARPTRWHQGMREWQDQVLFPAKLGAVTYSEPLCWAYVGSDTVCIRRQGHDKVRSPRSTAEASC